MKVLVCALVLLFTAVASASYSCSESKYTPLGKYYGESTECVALVKHACGAPQTTLWKRGTLAKGASLARNTAIATFEGPNNTYKGHAAVYLYQTSAGIQVVDQWNGQPAHERLIRFGGSGASNDGNKFYVIN